MSTAGVDAFLRQELPSPSIVSEPASVSQRESVANASANAMRATGPRRTPRKSLIVVLPEKHAVSPDLVSDQLPPEGDDEVVDVILACAGPPRSIAALQRRVRDIQVLLAPAGTSTEDLRELAMSQAAGDIVTLLSGTPV
jgi:hypothetical protein